MKGWTWVVLTVLIVTGIIGGFYIGSGRVRAQQDEPIEIRVQKYTPEQVERNAIVRVAACCQLIEARQGEDGWIIHVKDHVEEIAAYQLFRKAITFFRDLESNHIDVQEAVFEIVTDELQDIWGNRLNDVTIMRLVFDKERYEKTNWSAVRPENVRYVATDIWWHDEVEQEIIEDNSDSDMN